MDRPARTRTAGASPFTKAKLGITYPTLDVEDCISKAKDSNKGLLELDIDSRFDMLKISLDGVSKHFFELAYATMHTTGQSFMMSFQASGPHAADRALEAMVASYIELTTFENRFSLAKTYYTKIYIFN